MLLAFLCLGLVLSASTVSAQGLYTKWDSLRRETAHKHSGPRHQNKNLRPDSLAQLDSALQ